MKPYATDERFRMFDSEHTRSLRMGQMKIVRFAL
jgi:hypothetical protein